MLWIRIRMDPTLLPWFGSDPTEYEKQINKIFISLWILECVYWRTSRYLVDSYFWLNLRCFYFIFKYRVLIKIWLGSGSAWIWNFCLDQDPELGKFKVRSGSGINHSGSPTLLKLKHNLKHINKHFKLKVCLMESLF